MLVKGVPDEQLELASGWFYQLIIQQQWINSSRMQAAAFGR